MVQLRRVKFNRARVKKLIADHKSSKKLPSWAEDVTIKGSNLFFQGKQVVPSEDVDDFLRERVYSKTKSPVSMVRDAGYTKIQKETIGISRRRFMSWLKRQEIHQQNSLRPKEAKRAGQKVYSRNIVQADLVEAKTKDLQVLGRKLDTYFLTVASLLTGFMHAVEVKTKKSGPVAKVMAEAFNKLEQKLGKPIKTLQTDAGGEFLGAPVQKLLKKRGIKHQVVRLGAKIEQANGLWQRKFYVELHKHGGGKIQRYIDAASQIVNETKSRVLGVSPVEALELPDVQLAKKFNNARQRPGKSLLPPIAVGSWVRILKLSKKQQTIGYKSYRQHYTEPYKVTAKKGRAFVVNGKTWPRDRLLPVPPVDKKSQALIRSRGPQLPTKEQQKKHRATAKQKMDALKAEARIAPRRTGRKRTNKGKPQ